LPHRLSHLALKLICSISFSLAGTRTLMDFAREHIAGAKDTQIATAARMVHAGTKKSAQRIL